MTPNEFAEFSGRDRSIVHDDIRNAKIPSFTIGQTTNIPTTWILKTFGLTA